MSAPARPHRVAGCDCATCVRSHREEGTLSGRAMATLVALGFTLGALSDALGLHNPFWILGL